MFLNLKWIFTLFVKFPLSTPPLHEYVSVFFILILGNNVALQ